jgi:molybdopterin synthase sulfur carrier subunit
MIRIRIKAFAEFRSMIGPELRLELEDGATFRALLDALYRDHPELKEKLQDTDGGLKEDVFVLRNGIGIDESAGLDELLFNGDEFVVMPAAIGG